MFFIPAVPGATFSFGKDHTAILADRLLQCPVCRLMTAFFVNRNGRTKCYACDRKEVE